jgi:hypothetical protein
VIGTPKPKGEGCLPKLGSSAGKPATMFCKERHVAVYLLELNNGDISVGSTDGLRRRFDSHQNGRVVSTSKYLPAARGASR